MADSTVSGGHGHQEGEVHRRDFLHIATASLAGVGAAAVAWPMIVQMNPAANVKALASIEVDLSPVEVGQVIKVKWQGKPVFIRRRTEEQIAQMEAVDADALPDPERDSERVQQSEWLIALGVCTHLGCVPVANSGDFQGWFCPCHGSHYDMSGRIRKGPAPKNLEIPPYQFVSDTKILIG